MATASIFVDLNSPLAYVCAPRHSLVPRCLATTRLPGVLHLLFSRRPAAIIRRIGFIVIYAVKFERRVVTICYGPVSEQFKGLCPCLANSNPSSTVVLEKLTLL